MLFRIQAKDPIGIVRAEKKTRNVERAAQQFRAHVAYAKGAWSRVELMRYEAKKGGGQWRKVRHASHKGGGHWKFGGRGL